MAKVEHITEGPIYPTILRLAWPVLAAMFLEFAMSVANYFWVGYLGTPEQDAVTTSMVVTWTVYATISIIVIGITAMVSRAIGAGDREHASYVSKQGIQMAIGAGIFFSLAGFFAAPYIMKFMKAAPRVAEMGNRNNVQKTKFQKMNDPTASSGVSRLLSWAVIPCLT